MEQLPKLELARIACIQNRYFRLGIEFFFIYIKKKMQLTMPLAIQQITRII